MFLCVSVDLCNVAASGISIHINIQRNICIHVYIFIYIQMYVLVGVCERRYLPCFGSGISIYVNMQ